MDHLLEQLAQRHILIRVLLHDLGHSHLKVLLQGGMNLKYQQLVDQHVTQSYSKDWLHLKDKVVKENKHPSPPGSHALSAREAQTCRPPCSMPAQIWMLSSVEVC